MKFLLILFLTWQGVATHADEGNYYAMKKVAYRYFNGGKNAKAIRYVQAFIEKHPESYRAQNLLAHFYYWEGKKEQSRKILEKVVQKSDLAEAKRLLRRLQKVSVAPKSKEDKSGQENVPKKREDISADLAFLLEYVKTHPFDVENRKFLLHYFISVNETKAALRMAHEILRIDPNESETLRLVQETGLLPKEHIAQNVASQPEMDKIVSVLNNYFVQQKYRRFVNFYNAVTHQNVYLPEYIHIDAVRAAVEIQAFALARRILQQHDFTSGKHVRELRTLLDQKVLHISSGKRSRL